MLLQLEFSSCLSFRIPTSNIFLLFHTERRGLLGRRRRRRQQRPRRRRRVRPNAVPLLQLLLRNQGQPHRPHFQVKNCSLKFRIRKVCGSIRVEIRTFFELSVSTFTFRKGAKRRRTFFKKKKQSKTFQKYLLICNFLLHGGY